MTRKRGRPKNTDIDDSHLLKAMADKIVSRKISVTAAAREVLKERSDWKGNSEESVNRRLRGKWRPGSAELLAGARMRATPARSSGGGGSYYPGVSVENSVQRYMERQMRQFEEADRALKMHRDFEKQMGLNQSYQKHFSASDMLLDAYRKANPVFDIMEKIRKQDEMIARAYRGY